MINEATDGSFMDESIIETTPEADASDVIVTYKCDICLRAFKSMRSLDAHLLKHGGINISCKACKVAFTSLEQL